MGDLFLHRVEAAGLAVAFKGAFAKRRAKGRAYFSDVQNGSSLARSGEPNPR